MNLSLKKSKLLLLAVFALLSITNLKAQSKSKSGFAGSINVGYGSAIISDEKYQQFMDTMQSKTNGVLTKSVNGWFMYSFSKKVDLLFGIGYQEATFGRRQSNLNFNNYTYPGIGIGKIEDLSNIERGIQYTYRFSYLNIPFQMMLNTGRSSDYKWTFSFVPGTAINILVNHKMIANLNDGFSIDQKDIFTFDSTGFKARTIAVNFSAGFRFQKKDEDGKSYFLQPMAMIYPLSVTSADLKAVPWSISLQFGAIFSASK
jgi:hypothetical protein